MVEKNGWKEPTSGTTAAQWGDLGCWASLQVVSFNLPLDLAEPELRPSGEWLPKLRRPGWSGGGRLGVY